MSKKTPKPEKSYHASTVLKYSPQKARLIINAIRGKKITQALQILMFMNKSQAKKISDLVKSSYINLNLSDDDLKNYTIAQIVAEEAQKYYRVTPRARGSAHRIRRRYSRVKIKIAPINLDKISKKNVY